MVYRSGKLTRKVEPLHNGAVRYTLRHTTTGTQLHVDSMTETNYRSGYYQSRPNKDGDMGINMISPFTVMVEDDEGNSKVYEDFWDDKKTLFENYKDAVDFFEETIFDELGEPEPEAQAPPPEDDGKDEDGKDDGEDEDGKDDDFGDEESPKSIEDIINEIGEEIQEKGEAKVIQQGEDTDALMRFLSTSREDAKNQFRTRANIKNAIGDAKIFDSDNKERITKAIDLIFK